MMLPSFVSCIILFPVLYCFIVCCIILFAAHMNTLEGTCPPGNLAHACRLVFGVQEYVVLPSTAQRLARVALGLGLRSQGRHNLGPTWCVAVCVTVCMLCVCVCV